LKILISTPSFFPHSFGGGETYVLRLAKELLSSGNDVRVLTMAEWNGFDNNAEVSSYIYSGIPVTSFSINPSIATQMELFSGYGPVTAQVLRNIINDYNPDIVHINGMKPILVEVCEEIEKPYTITAHHVGIICPAGGRLKPDGTVCQCTIDAMSCLPCSSYWRRPKWYTGGLIGKMPKILYRALGQSLNRTNKLSYIQRGLIYPWLIDQLIAIKKKLLVNAAQIIAPSQSIRDLLVANGCDYDKILLMPHGVDLLQKFPVENIGSRPIRFGYIGRIDPQKGLHVLLHAARLIKDPSRFEIHVFGAARNARHEAYWRDLFLAHKDLFRVIDHGFIPHDGLQAIFSNIDILVVPSLVPESFGLVVAEAFSAGKPVIVFKSGALSELVSHEKNGFIVEDRNERSLSSSMQRVIDEPDLIKEMTDNIPRVTTIKEYASAIERLYCELISYAKQRSTGILKH
jgi:glycosyltransferase involved in cell wall biosynthesis